ncbi:putative pre-mRNA-splicing factor ATP-dependent RNA helicase mog-4 [Toxocara canis]|uniref:Putative pre-mRNA-splicing factor ATP-dependent RNA helicase mog-4 n=1 Tax=Toxocara canis TaxID=6265 RepID=A0A0B2VEN2_TOXCA|nr:putative pre-mRNA-splicing factor ATP-dependent RNA helicase mog-4 [Toxocara canis]
MTSSVEDWVNDELYSLLGISDRTVSQFVRALARKSTDTDDLLQRFRDTDALQVTPAVKTFASSLLAMIPHAAPKVAKAPQPSAAEMKAREAIRLNRRLKLISSDEEDEVPIKKRKESKKKKKEVVKESAIDELDRIKAEEEEDVRQRDELAARIRQRDKEKTRNVVEKSDKKAEAEAAKRLNLENANREKIVPQLREESRKQYLAKRKVDKLAELEKMVQDDEEYFANEE